MYCRLIYWNFLGIYQAFSGTKSCKLGLQPVVSTEHATGTSEFPSTSGVDSTATSLAEPDSTQGFPSRKASQRIKSSTSSVNSCYPAKSDVPSKSGDSNGSSNEPKTSNFPPVPSEPRSSVLAYVPLPEIPSMSSKPGKSSGSPYVPLFFVMPSSSPRAASYPRASDKLPFYVELRELRDRANGIVRCDDVDECGEVSGYFATD